MQVLCLPTVIASLYPIEFSSHRKPKYSVVGISETSDHLSKPTTGRNIERLSSLPDPIAAQPDLRAEGSYLGP